MLDNSGLNTFHDRCARINGCLDHLVKQGWVGTYWLRYARMISAQIKSTGGQPFSRELYLASTFSGDAANGVTGIASAESCSLRYRIAGRLQSLLLALPNWRGLNPVWNWTFRERGAAHHSAMASLHYETLVAYAAQLFASEIREFDLRSPTLYGTDRVAIADRLLSFRTLMHFNTFLRLREVVDAATRTVVEIGAGSGELARIFVASGQITAYVIVDIPPALAFSQELFLTEFGADRISVYDPARTSVDLTGKQIVCSFLTPDQLAMVPACDLGLNIASFGEMAVPIVERYVNTLKQCGFTEFVSINQRLGKTGNAEKIGRREYEKWMAPAYRIDAAYSFSAYRPKLRLAPDIPDSQGYQLLHFRRLD